MSSFYVLDSDSVLIRPTTLDDIPEIVKLQEESFADLAKMGNIWHPDELRSHLIYSQKVRLLLSLKIRL